MYEYGNLTSLNIEDVLPNRFQPRIHFDENKLNELAESIRKYGVIQPIVVRQIGDKYEIIAGERRYKASKIANKSTIPAIVINLNDKESEEIALLENVQRQNLTPIEEAVSYKRILDMGYITQAQLAEKLGKTQSTIANKVRLLNLDDQVQYALLNGKISERHARSLLRIHDKNMQIEMLNKIINERLTVKKTDDAIKELLGDKDVLPMDNSEVKVTETQVNNQFLELSNELDSQEAEKVKVPFVKSEPVEDLFSENEPIKKPVRAVARGSHEIIRVSLPKDLEEKLMRKDEKGMDIDRIMREAQDINAPQENKDISNLMKQDNPVSNAFETSVPVEPVINPEPQTQEEVNEIPLVNEEQNKFINFSGIVQPEEAPKPEPVVTNEVSFDSIFNQTPVDLQPVNPEPVMVVGNINESESNFNEMKTETPNVVEPVANNESMSIAEAVQKAMNSKAPEEPVSMTESTSINEVVAETPNNTEPINEVNQSSLYNELVQPEMSVKPEPIQQFEPQQPVVPEPMPEPVQTFEPQGQINPEPMMTQPAESTMVPPVAVSEPTVDTIPVPPMAPIEPVAAPVIETPSEPSVVQPVVTPEPINVNPAPSFETAPAEPVITDIPSSDILEAPTAETMASNVTENVVSAPANDNNFIEVIRLIRNCADEIEKLGYKIDVDEIDLGNSYQANFKIDKQ